MSFQQQQQSPFSSAAPPSDVDPTRFSWLEPHPQFVVALVGPEEVPFAIQKDFLCAKSASYRKHFANQGEDAIESIVKLHDTSVEVFGFAQHFMYTGMVVPADAPMPSYEVLVGVWKLGHTLEIEGLCHQTIEAMMDVRQATERIPAAPLLVQVWKDTPEGSSMRRLLLEWAAEYVRSSEGNAEFAKSLPQEVLSELVLAMSRPDTLPLVQFGGNSTHAAFTPAQQQRKVVHYLDQEDEEEADPASLSSKKQRRPEMFSNGPASKAAARKTKAVPVVKAAPRRRSNVAANGEPQEFTTEQKLLFCQDLLARMLSGPGFWTRLVGPFKDPVDPVVDNVPDYFEKIAKPMDLSTMKAKMDASEYTSEEEFLGDMTQIFTNCKTYWKPTDTIWAACEKLEKTFMDKYSQMNKWLMKMEGSDEH
ncbi:Bromodomain-containing protein [Cryphonectria parasitica EP155]|uniref:Bromodomain-containing protein n=1 Tax=Cryphonectria parasitica (strain ATCC 38755 / EP155) TaxID=660469 RepID=A0A9P5CQK7_CRYP1|nr:Bromodomain-containing protein [Cryphonectria parasitica EP155]KAF3767629.1 Bromodomain-containing protein [Cryphonectria parasitica EP155]